MGTGAPRRDGSQIGTARVVFVTQFTLPLSRARSENWITQLRAEAISGAVVLTRGAVEKILDLVAIGTRELELVTAMEREEVLAVHVCAQAPHQAQVDD